MAKCKLTPELTDKLVKLLDKGAFVNAGCDAVGITETTYYDWLSKADKAIEDGREDKYTKFSESIKKAQGNGECKILQTILEICKDKKDWTGLAWALERRNHRRYGKVEKQEHTISTDKHLAKAFDELGL